MSRYIRAAPSLTQIYEVKRILSQVEVAEGSGQGVHDSADLYLVAGVAHVDDVAHAGLARLWLVGPGDVAVVASVELAVTLAWVEGLPESPHAVHHAVVKPKGRITGRCEEISTRVTTRETSQQTEDPR